MEALSTKQPLLDSGLLKSVDIYQVIVYLEPTFGIAIPNAEISKENFNTVEAMTKMVLRLSNKNL